MNSAFPVRARPACRPSAPSGTPAAESVPPHEEPAAFPASPSGTYAYPQLSRQEASLTPVRITSILTLLTIPTTFQRSQFLPKLTFAPWPKPSPIPGDFPQTPRAASKPRVKNGAVTRDSSLLLADPFADGSGVGFVSHLPGAFWEQGPRADRPRGSWVSCP